jgi:hypothetical protein
MQRYFEAFGEIKSATKSSLEIVEPTLAIEPGDSSPSEEIVALEP